MVIEFRVKNYKSIKDLQVFSMVPSKKKFDNEVVLLQTGKVTVQPSAALFGRNGGGKSNMLDALARLQSLVLKTEIVEDDQKIRFEYYKLDANNKNIPTYFGLDFVADDGIKYTYEIEFNNDEFLLEELNYYPKNQKANLFKRTAEGVSFGESFYGVKSPLERLLYKNQLLLAKVESENIEVLKVPYDFFWKKIYYRRPGELSNSSYMSHFAKNIYDSKYPNYCENLSRLLRAADTGIIELVAEKRDLSAIVMPDSITPEIRKQIERELEYFIITKHKIEGDEKNQAFSDFSIFEESMGTRRLLETGGLMLEALHDGQVLIIDEFDISLHPLLTKSLIKLFHSPKTNPKNAQLIISTQDISLFDTEIFSYDQMWIAEKTYEGFSHYYSLSDIKGLRKDIPIQRWYMEGRFGGIPVINYSELEFEII